MPNFDTDNKLMSVWKALYAGTHRAIAEALLNDVNVKQKVDAVLAAPSDEAAINAMLEQLCRATGNCVGQMGIAEIAELLKHGHMGLPKITLDPNSDTKSIYIVLPPGTNTAIYVAIRGSEGFKIALASKDYTKIIFDVSRMAGNCIGEAAIDEIGDIIKLIIKLLQKVGAPVG